MSASASSAVVKLIAYVDELEGGPGQVSLTVLAKPTWPMRRVQKALVKTYANYLEDYPEFSQAYTITDWRAFPPKPQWDETDLVSDILEKPKGLIGPHIHIYATIAAVEKEKEEEAITTTVAPKMAADITATAGSRKRMLNDSAVAALRNRSSGQRAPSSGTLKRPTKTGSSSGGRKDAPRKDLYDIGDDDEIEAIHDEEFRTGPAPKRARTGAGPSRQSHTTPLPPRHASQATPTSAQLPSSSIQRTPLVAYNTPSIQSKAPGSQARGLWTDRENRLMLAEIIKNGADTPTATLRDTLFPGRTTEGIRKRRKKVQNDYAEMINRRRGASDLPLANTPSSSKVPESSIIASSSKTPRTARTPASSKAPATARTPAISKTPAKFKTAAVSKSPAGSKTPRISQTPTSSTTSTSSKPPSKFKTPRLPVSRRRRDSLPCVLIDVVDDPSQQKLEIRPGGAVRVKSKGDDSYITPNSSPPVPQESVSAPSMEPVVSQDEKSEIDGFDELVAEAEQPQVSMDWLPQVQSQNVATKSLSKFLLDARAAAASDEHAAESQLYEQSQNGSFEIEDEIESSNPVVASTPSPIFTVNHSPKRGPSPRVVVYSKAISSIVAMSETEAFLSSSPEKIGSPSQSTTAAWIECERSTKVIRASPPWPEDTPIAKSAVANAEARKAGIKKARSTVSRISNTKVDEDERSHGNRFQSNGPDDMEGADQPGQTPRTLHFKARTPRSLSRSIARRGSDSRGDASEGSESESSDEDDSDSSADESDVDMDVDVDTNKDCKRRLQLIDVEADSESDSSDSDSRDSSDSESEDALADVAAEVREGTKVEDETEADSTSVSSVSSHKSDIDSSSSDDSSEEDEDESADKSIKGGVAHDLAIRQVQFSNEDRASEDEDIEGSVADYLADQQLRSDAGLSISEKEALPKERSRINHSPRLLRKSSTSDEKDLDSGANIVKQTKPKRIFPTSTEPGRDESVEASREGSSGESSDDSDSEEDENDRDEEEGEGGISLDPRTTAPTEPSSSISAKFYAVVIPRTRSLEENNALFQAHKAQSPAEEKCDQSFINLQEQVKVIDSMARNMAGLFKRK